MYENFLLIKSETQRARTLPNCRRVRVCLPRVCCWQLAESPFDPVSSLALCVLLFGISWREAAVRHVRPFSVRSHARAPSAHHRRRRGHESSHTLRWYWWGWMDGAGGGKRIYSVQCCWLTLSRFSDNTSDQRRGISLRWEDVVVGGLIRKLFSWLISQPPPARRRTTLDELGKERTKTGWDCLLCLSLVSISSTRIVLQLLLFVELFSVQLSKSLACPTHFNSITVTSSVLISCFTSLQKQRNRKEE